MKIRPAHQNLAGPAVILPASSQLSLVGLHPCRAHFVSLAHHHLTLSYKSVQYFSGILFVLSMP